MRLGNPLVPPQEYRRRPGRRPLPGAPARASLGVPGIGRGDRARGPPMVVAGGDPDGRVGMWRGATAELRRAAKGLLVCGFHPDPADLLAGPPRSGGTLSDAA